LIGYVYDECEPVERAAVQEHLETCAECRTEIAALRSVRSDLQSWQVPDSEYVSVWRPFAPAPAPSWWQQVPRWAMAAAAGVVMMSGAAGGAVSYMVLNQQPVQASSQTAAVQPVSAVTVNDVNALEQRLRTLVKVEVDRLNTQVQLVSSRPAVQMSAEQEVAFHTAFDRQLGELRATNDKQVDAINALYNKLGQMQVGFDIRHEFLKTRVTNLASAVGER